MSTIESLFGLDPELLALKNDALNNAEDANLGALAPKGYGALTAAFNKLGRNVIGREGLFGNKDKVLTKRTIIDKIMQNVGTGTQLEQYEKILKGFQDNGLTKEAYIMQEKVNTLKAGLATIATKSIKDKKDYELNLDKNKLSKQKFSLDVSQKLMEEYNTNVMETDGYLAGIAQGIKHNEEGKDTEKSWFNSLSGNNDALNNSMDKSIRKLITQTDIDGGPLYNSLQVIIEDVQEAMQESNPKDGSWVPFDNDTWDNKQFQKNIDEIVKLRKKFQPSGNIDQESTLMPQVKGKLGVKAKPTERIYKVNGVPTKFIQNENDGTWAPAP